ncbi:MAG: VWA domain-containing protein [Deltaproteobacteria bacterium]|nr:VWA domain-containing protein [Deltaproteobacteria bacterium]
MVPRRWSLGLLLSCVVAVGCATADDAGTPAGGDPDTSVPSDTSLGDDLGTGDDGGGLSVDGTVEAAPPPDGPMGDACIGVGTEAKPLPLDIYVMYDQSGSMDEKTSAGPTKWEAVKTAFNAFLSDSASTGIGVGIQYFAYYPPGVPLTCTAEADCKGYGPCANNKACDKESVAAKTIVPCSTAADCKSGGACVNVGVCRGNPGYGCFNNANCPILTGPCDILKYCQMRECKVADYATPEVAIAPLPGVKDAIVKSLNAHKPSTDTPTGAALAGAIQHAKTWKAANPTHAVAVLLVTDGEPTACTPIDIPSISKLASDAVSATPSINTYVIGVLGKDDASGASNLDAISKAGNGKPAFIVSTTSDVTKDFLAALNAIRSSALPCEYELPPAASADYFKVNVKVTTGSGSSTILYVGSADKCDPTSGGWYYDVDPSAGTPKKILMCPATCTGFKAGGSIDIEVGCKTESIVK